MMVDELSCCGLPVQTGARTGRGGRDGESAIRPPPLPGALGGAAQLAAGTARLVPVVGLETGPPAPEGWKAWRDPWGRPSDPPWDERDMGPPAAPGTPPGPLIRNWSEAEMQTVLLLHRVGFRGAKASAAGSDGGIDVAGAGVAAQVKWHATLVGRPDLQRLVGAAGSGRTLVFVSRAGYSAPAIAFADQVSMALLTLDVGAVPRALNGYGRALLARLPQ